jgi:hypothetical protein
MRSGIAYLARPGSIARAVARAVVVAHRGSSGRIAARADMWARRGARIESSAVPSARRGQRGA